MSTVMWQPGMTLNQMERQVIEAALIFNRGNRAATARSLGISDRTIDNKLEVYVKEDEERKKAQEKQKAEEEDYQRRARGNLADAAFTPQAVSKAPIKVPQEMREPRHEMTPPPAAQVPAPGAKPKTRVPVQNEKKK